MPAWPCRETADCDAHGFNRNAEDGKAAVFMGLTPGSGLLL